MVGGSLLRGQSSGDEFFIISSVNPPKMQVVAKRPTEVTQVIFVDGDTKYLDRTGRAIILNDLHAGDTVFIRERRGSDHPVAQEIRIGRMTISELRKRDLATPKQISVPVRLSAAVHLDVNPSPKRMRRSLTQTSGTCQV
jgi:hypothetical protein